MKNINVEELKRIQLDILKNVDKFCREYDIQYSLAYGTLLGAIRHKGYIPRDDDIDIFMTRPYYNKFIETYNGYNDNLYVISPELDKDYYAPYANVCDKRTILIEDGNAHTTEIGVKIDIFPIDAVPTRMDSYISMKKKINDLKYNLWVKRTPFSNCTSIRSKISWLYRRLRTIFNNFSSIQDKIRSIATSIDLETADYYDNVVWDNVYARCKKDVYTDITDIEFENCIFKGVKDYDTYLRNKYGDYMVLPPEAQRIMLHNFRAWWKEEIS